MATLTYYSIATYVYDGLGAQNFSIWFPYIQKNDVSVFINGLPTSEYTWADATTIEITTTLTVEDSVVFRRYTRKDQRWTEFQNGAILTESDLNVVTSQLLYLIQELYDYGLVRDDPDPPPGNAPGDGDGDGGGTGDNPLISEIIAAILNTELFQQLIALIDLLDINAESIIQNSLENHSGWSKQRIADDVLSQHGNLISDHNDLLNTIDGLLTNIDNILVDIGLVLDEHDAKIIQNTSTIIEEGLARATAVLALGARIGESEATILQLFDALATETEARATAILALSAEFDGAEADIVQLFEAVANETSARATAILALIARIGPAEASIINLQEAVATETEARATAILSIQAEIDGNTANITSNLTAIADEQSARATAISGLQTTVDGNLATLLTVEQALSTDISAEASRIDILDARLDTDLGVVSARVLTIENAYVNTTQSVALIQQELEVKFDNHDWEGQFIGSSYINGVEAAASQNLAEISGITSYLVGTGSMSEDTPDPGSLGGRLQQNATTIGGIQTTVTAHTNQLEVEAELRYALFAAFYPGGDQELDATQMISAMEQTWTAYADAKETSILAITTLESNRQPIFFRSAAPDHQAAEFVGSPWATSGFPDGSVWFRKMTNGTLKQYGWDRTLTSGDYGPFGAVQGVWEYSPDFDTEAQGALIQTIQNTYLTETQVGAEISQQLQAVLDGDVAAIRTDLEAWIRPASEGTPGLMYTGWTVRANQYINGVPVIAGVGLGLQSDPDNPEGTSRSDFIVMADHFSIISPPPADILNGVLDPADIILPFYVDTASQKVVINGDLFVTGTFSGFDGYMGRLTFTELDLSGDPVDPVGFRMSLMSDTKGYATGDDGTCFLQWAGSGSMTKNNATFYIDCDGNAFYNGTVTADNIVGQFNDALSINFHTTLANIITANGGTRDTWTYFDENSSGNTSVTNNGNPVYDPNNPGNGAYP